jgi:hypothetical protein
VITSLICVSSMEAESIFLHGPSLINSVCRLPNMDRLHCTSLDKGLCTLL